MDKNTAISKANEYSEMVRSEFKPEMIMMFGSYVNGEPKEESDIDIAVIFNGFKGNWLETSAKLWKLTRSVDTRIEPILLDITQNKSGFVGEIIKTGYTIYKE